MSQVTLEILNDQREFRPGDDISGAAFWKYEAPLKRAEVRLFWHTQGKASQALQVADVVSFPEPHPEEARPFKFRAPPEPYSFLGKLITLVWALELVVEPGSDSARLEIIISPTGKKIVL